MRLVNGEPSPRERQRVNHTRRGDARGPACAAPTHECHDRCLAQDVGDIAVRPARLSGGRGLRWAGHGHADAPVRAPTGAAQSAAKRTAAAKTPAVPRAAAAAAHAVNVRARDVPGMVASVPSIDPHPRRRGGFGVRLARCAGGSARSEEVASLSSASFTRSRSRAHTTATRVLRSVVHLMRTPASASGDMAALRSPRAASCLAELRKAGSRSHLAAHRTARSPPRRRGVRDQDHGALANLG